MGNEPRSSDGSLSPTEAAFIEAVESARVFIPPAPGNGAVISAELIRKILLNIDVELDSDCTRRIEVTAFGIRIGCSNTAPASRNGWHDAPRTRIVGVLDLAGLGPLPNGQSIYLELTWCDFDASVNLSNATLSHLSLRGSRFGSLLLDNARIEGSLDLRQCGPRANKLLTAQGEPIDQSQAWPFAGNLFVFNGKQEEITWTKDALPLLASDQMLSSCVISARDARIGGSALLDCSDFCHEESVASPFHLSKEPLAGTLDFFGIRVEGRIQVPQTTIIGTFNLKSARVGGDIWLNGSRLLAHTPAAEGDYPEALNLQSARIGGILGMSVGDARNDHRQDFKYNIVSGQIFGIGLQAGSIWFGGGLFVTGFGQRYPALFCFQAANIAESVRFGSYQNDEGDDDIERVDWCRIEGGLYLNSITIDGTLQISCVNSRGPNHSRLSRHERNGPEGRYVRDFYLDESASCWVNLGQAVVRRDVDVTHSQLRNPSDDGDIQNLAAITAYKASIGIGVRLGYACTCHGPILLNHARIHRGVSIACDVHGARQGGNRTPIAVDLSETEVLGNIDIGTGGSDRVGSTTRCDNKQITLKGSLLLAGTRVHGSVLVGSISINFTVARDSTLPPPSLDFAYRQGISFADANIAGSLEIGQIVWPSPNQRDSAAINDDTGSVELYKFLTEACRDNGNEVAIFHLPFYTNVRLIEVRREPEVRRILWDTKVAAGSREAAAFLDINGESTPIHTLNERIGADDAMHEGSHQSRLRLSDRAKREAYLAFFCDSITASEGPFKIQEFLETDDDTVQLERMLDPTANPELSTVIKARLLYGQCVYNAYFELDYRGRVAMLEDEPIYEANDASADRFTNSWRPVLDARFTAFDFRLHDSSRRNYDMQRLKLALQIARLKDQMTKLLARVKQKFATTYRDLRYDESAVALNLQGLRCGSLNDNFGNNWHLDSAPVVLQAAGIRIERLEAASHAAGQFQGQADHGSSSRSSLEKGFEEAAGIAAASRDASTSRLIWLAHQAPLLPTRNDHDYRRGLRRMTKWLPQRMKWLPRMLKWYRTFDEDYFVPQVYDRFAVAHIQAGEVLEGHKILREKKDIASVIRLRKAIRSWWGRSFAMCDAHRGERESSRRAYGVPLLILGIVLFMGATLVDTGSIWNSARRNTALVCLLLGLWPALEAIFMLFFSIGFQHGLSARAALITFGLCVVFGTAMTHIGRTGSLVPQANWADLSHGELDPDIAIVLDVPYQAQAHERPVPAISTRALDSVPEPRREPRIAGETLMASALPCNLEINDFIYALDNFVPLIDLNQARRCSIRKPATRTDGTIDFGGRTNYYNAWHVGKAIYVALGWIVTSLLILTVSGVMKRDLER